MVYPEVDVVDPIGEGLSVAVLVVKSRVPESEIPAGESPFILAGGIFPEGIGEKVEVEVAEAVAADVEVGAVDGETADAHLFIGEAEAVEPHFYPGGGGQGLTVGFLEPDILQNDFVEEGDVNAPDVNARIELLREIVRQPVGQKGLHPGTLDGQVKTRQQQKEDRQGDQDYFPAFFDNFAF